MNKIYSHISVLIQQRIVTIRNAQPLTQFHCPSVHSGVLLSHRRCHRLWGGFQAGAVQAAATG